MYSLPLLDIDLYIPESTCPSSDYITSPKAILWMAFAIHEGCPNLRCACSTLIGSEKTRVQHASAGNVTEGVALKNGPKPGVRGKLFVQGDSLPDIRKWNLDFHCRTWNCLVCKIDHGGKIPAEELRSRLRNNVHTVMGCGLAGKADVVLRL